MFLCSKNILSNPKIAVNRYNVIEILTKWFGQKKMLLSCFLYIYIYFILSKLIKIDRFIDFQHFS